MAHHVQRSGPPNTCNIQEQKDLHKLDRGRMRAWEEAGKSVSPEGWPESEAVETRDASNSVSKTGCSRGLVLFPFPRKYSAPTWFAPSQRAVQGCSTLTFRVVLYANQTSVNASWGRWAGRPAPFSLLGSYWKVVTWQCIFQSFTIYTVLFARHPRTWLNTSKGWPWQSRHGTGLKPLLSPGLSSHGEICGTLAWTPVYPRGVAYGEEQGEANLIFEQDPGPICPCVLAKRVNERTTRKHYLTYLTDAWFPRK